ncbi:MAG: DUF4214 domain-containing protein [Clostridiales bacterium]|nr:DUF4214 domain-containing protein [Clostridiales bacterium]
MIKKCLGVIACSALVIPMAISVFSAKTVRAEADKDGSVAINSQNFPDDAFRTVVASFDENKDNVLSKEEIAKVTIIEAVEAGISDMKGIEYFTALTTLKCNLNLITELDVSKNLDLCVLECSDNKIESLDVSKNTKLVEFYCTNNALKEINVSTLTELEIFWCAKNEIESLDISKNTSLRVFSCYKNKISKLDFSHNPHITGLRCGSNKLTELDLSNLKNMLYFACEYNQLTSLNVSFMKELVQLNVEGNHLTELKLGRHMNLENLDTAYKDLTVVDVRKCPLLLSEFEEYGIKNDEYFKYLYCGIPFDIGESHEQSDYDKMGRILPKDTESYIVLFTLDYATNLLGYEVPEVPGYPRKPIEPEVPTFEDFVERLYTVALSRESDPEGKTFWIKEVVENGKTGADCARFFLLEAPEFMNRNLTNENFVETLYDTFFDRLADADGKNVWLDELYSGRKTRSDVVNDFIESTEWCNVCATYGVKSGAVYHKATNPSKNAIDFATRLYTCCLGREPEKEGLEYWALALTNLDKTGAEAAQFFFESQEFVGFKTPIVEYLTRLYTTFMDREPADSEVNYWVNEVKAGRQDRHSVLVFFAQSPEFTAICKKYGIDRGQI